MSPRRLSCRLVSGLSAGALAVGLSVLATAPTHAGSLKTCNDYIKAKNISCLNASRVAEEGLARLLDQNATVVRFDGWKCKRPDRDADRFRCAKKKSGTLRVVKYSSA
jgi:hypothetical protein